MLISSAYQSLLESSHTAKKEWGKGAIEWAEEIDAHCRSHQLESILDYGCGKGALVNALQSKGYKATGYDPGIPEYAEFAKPADFLCCIDVLEHVEPDCLDYVLNHIKSLAPHCLLVIATRKAKHILPDGRNAHLIIQEEDWWLEKLCHYFNDIQLITPHFRRETAVMCNI